MSMMEIMVPELVDEPPPVGIHLAARHPLPENARITLIDNGKPKVKEFLSMIPDGLRESFQIGSFVIFSKDDAHLAIYAAAVIDQVALQFTGVLAADAVGAY